MKKATLLIFGLIAAGPALAQTKSSCQVYFQVVQMDRRIPGGVVSGMNAEQRKWWQTRGQKKYPELCWNGSVMSNDKPRYLLIWSSEKPGGPVHIAKGSAAEQPAGADTYGKSASAIEAASSDTHPLLKRTILIVDLSSPGEPPIELTKDWWFFRSHSQRVLDEALRFLVAAPPYPPSPRQASGSN